MSTTILIANILSDSDCNMDEDEGVADDIVRDRMLSHEDREAYFLRLIEAESDLDGNDNVNGAENECEYYMPRGDAEDSDAEQDQFEIEVNEESDYDESSEDNDESSDEMPTTSSEADLYYNTKDNVKWYKKAPNINRRGAVNIIREKLYMGPNPITKNMSIVDIFNSIMSDAVKDLILRFTNKKAEAVYRKWNSENTNFQKTWKLITDEELLGFFGILLIMGAHNSSKETLTELWRQNAYPIYRATMSRKRFAEILRFLRFDWHATRVARQEKDKAAPIRDVFEMVNSNLRAHYRPYESITVDEQLFGFRGRTRFTQYMPSKPAKYGIKIWWACDSKTFYPLQGQIYTGKIDNARDVKQGERIVKELVGMYKNSGRNVTMDNFFTTLSLAKELATWKLSVVGTIKKNKRYVPEEFKPSRTREVASSLFGFSEGVTLVSYVPAKNKSVVLLSTMHKNKITSGPQNKPEIILYYNETKGGVDTMDKMLSQYSTKRSTFRWPLALFFNILDTAALASFIIYKENIGGTSVRQSQRKHFIERLGEDLCRPLILTRSKIPQITGRFPIRSAMEFILGEPLTATNQDADFEADETTERDATGRIKIKGKCHICCSYKKKRNTRQICVKCKKPICAEHRVCYTKCDICHHASSS
ncbi:piggyBac transposable element-derived protein 4-like [Calliphora vicina]|uniref:piggyBac transposable element-derived protein 4-like n=1 Tax=Calliphora vicina TaxID=7373 RepID=UPI00325A85CC